MALTISWADVVLVAPELSTTAAGLQTKYLAWVADEVSVTTFGSQLKADRAATYLAAHLATVNASSAISTVGTGGQLTGMTVGAVSKTFSAGSSDSTSNILQSGFRATKYGVEYLRLVGLYCSGPWTT